MPAPVKPSSFCSAVPSATSSLCDRIQAVFLRVPRLLCDFFTWMLNEDGTLTDAFIREVAAFPVGCALPLLTSTIPNGWLLGNGAEISRTTYSALFAVYGTRYGVGNGTTTFNLPNITRKFLMGYDAADPAVQVGATGGEASHVLTTAELPASFTFQTTLPGFRFHDLESGTPHGGIVAAAGVPSITTPPTVTGSLPCVNAGGGQGHATIPPFMACAWIIRY